jgi:hypothetical protein
MAVGPPVRVELVNVPSGGNGEVLARVTARSVSQIDAWQASATRACAQGDVAPLRLWPGDATGAFTARVPIGARTGCRVAVRVEGVGEATAHLASGAGGPVERWTSAEMEALAARTGGFVVRDGRVQPLVQAWVATRGTARQPETLHPMRSWWWVLPFAVSLAGEWWLRRRAGLR